MLQKFGQLAGAIFFVQTSLQAVFAVLIIFFVHSFRYAVGVHVQNITRRKLNLLLLKVHIVHNSHNAILFDRHIFKLAVVIKHRRIVPAVDVNQSPGLKVKHGVEYRDKHHFVVALTKLLIRQAHN